MNDTMSLLLASVILAAGGIGLFMYKSSDDKSIGDDYNEDVLFSDDDKFENDEDDDFVDYEPKQVRSRANKTKRNKKTSGSSKRRYY